MSLRAIMTDYQSHEAAIRAVREQVFVIEQQVDRSEEYDDRDQVCSHVVVFDGEDAVATGRIDLEKGGKVGRLAVLEGHRRRGIGTLAMKTLEAYAARSGVDHLWFHAQTQAVDFYKNLGYYVCSVEFIEANIPHVKMEKRLN